jgi:hypothetical protein
MDRNKEVVEAQATVAALATFKQCQTLELQHRPRRIFAFCIGITTAVLVVLLVSWK